MNTFASSRLLRSILVSAALICAAGPVGAAVSLTPPPSPFSTRTDGMAALVALKGEGIVLGTKGPLVTAFVSPDCLYCIRLFKGLSPLVDAGRVRLRLIIIGPGDERAAAMGIRQSKDPVGALSTHFDGLVSGHDQTPAARPDKVLEHRLDRLESIAAGGQSTYGTPMLLICPQVASPRWVKGLPDFAWLTQSLASWPATGTRCDHASRAV